MPRAPAAAATDDDDDDDDIPGAQPVMVSECCGPCVQADWEGEGDRRMT
jgi:hypothetical protein